MIKKEVIVTFSGPEHTGKTTLEAAFVKFLTEHGVTVNMPFDPQRDQKMTQSIPELLDAFREKHVVLLVMEANTSAPHGGEHSG